MTTKLRPMTDRDLDAIMVLEEDLFADQAWSSAMLREELTDAHTRSYIVAVDEFDVPIGYAGLAAYDYEAHVLTIGTREDWQRRGVGQLLLDHLVQTASGRGVEKIVLEVRDDNLPAIALYERNKFAVAGVRPGYYQPGNHDALVMIREL